MLNSFIHNFEEGFNLYRLVPNPEYSHLSQENSNEQEIEKDDGIIEILEEFKKTWFVGFDYKIDDVISFDGKEFFESHENQISILLFYIQYLYANADKENVLYIDENTKQELYWHQNNGGLCIYLSIVLYFLLRTYSEIENDNIIYCQGYYDVTVNDLDTFLECGQAGKIGLHAWLEVNDSVVDVSIKQIENERIYKFKEKPFYVLGKVPEGIEYNGFRETHSCAKKYVKKMIKSNGIKREEWIHNHNQNALRVIYSLIQKGKESENSQ
ncbi:hypothetical protein [Paenibacillus pinihumi]|uniref:hypothetical protein n=1 Tax=Paenibacillus pinihumi TaxID=669462 RepID=UPI00040CCDB5|nr:hypothetical protein [Paenibacillus pinihumi]